MSSDLLLDDRIRGVPPGTDALAIGDVAQEGWHPADSRMSLPVLTLDEESQPAPTSRSASSSSSASRTRAPACGSTA